MVPVIQKPYVRDLIEAMLGKLKLHAAPDK
jgi:hypothetical protein